MNWGALSEIIWIQVIKMDFHYRDKLWKCLASESSKWQNRSRAEPTNWWKSFLRVTEILISHMQLMQPDRRSWVQDWMSPREHPVCQITGGCPSRNSSAATAGAWIPGSIGICSDPAQPLQSPHGVTHSCCAHPNCSPWIPAPLF